MNQAVDLRPSKWRSVVTLATSLTLLTMTGNEYLPAAATPTSGMNPPPPYGSPGPGMSAPQYYGRGVNPPQFFAPRGMSPPPHPLIYGGKNAAKPHAGASAPAKDEPIILQSSKPIVSAALSWQKWDDYINIKPGQEHIPLTLTFENGAGMTKFEDLRFRLAGRPLASMKDFKGSSTLNLNLTEAIGAGDSLLSIQGYGHPGARLGWKLTTPKPSAISVNPTTFSIKDKVVVKGKNFSEKAAADHVTIGGKAVTVSSAKKDQLELKLGTDVPGGKQDLVVTVGTFRCAPLKVTVKSAPEVSSVNFISTAPGQPITVYGKGFSATASENEVLIGGVSAPITSASAESITCTVPDLPFPQWYVPIVVKTNGQESTGTVTINLNQRVIENEGNPEN